MIYLSVREVAEKFSKSEETVKRWLRGGKFPNAFKATDKEGWKIPLSDLTEQALSFPQPEQTSLDFQSPQSHPHDNEREIISLAFQAVTLTTPTDELLELLTPVGIKRTLEVLLVMRQSPTTVKSPVGFIKRAIREGWTPVTLPEKVDRRRENFEARLEMKGKSDNHPFPFYNWLEE